MRAAGLRAMMRIVVVNTIGHDVGWLRLLLVALGGRAFGLLVDVVLSQLVLALLALPLVRLPAVQGPRVTVGAEVAEVIAGGLLDVTRVEAFDVLPRIASLAVDGITVVVRVVADALDGVWLLVYRVGGGARRASRVGRDGRLRNGLTLRDRRWYGKGPFCHNLAEASRWLQLQERVKMWVHLCFSLSRMTTSAAEVNS